MTENSAVLRAYEPARDRPALEQQLHEELSGSHKTRLRLIEEWQRSVDRGYVLAGAPDSYLFYRAFGRKLRIDNILASRGQLAPLLDSALPHLQARYPIVVSQSEAWSRVFGDNREAAGPAWARHQFEELRVEVLEVKLPAHLPTVMPSGYRMTGWRPEHLPLAACVMESAPDPLQERVPTHGAECVEIIRSACDFSLGMLAWRGQRLAGFVTVRPQFGIGQLFVSPGDQGLGVGGALLDRALLQLHQLSLVRVRLTMVEGNHAAWHLYQSRGFRCCADYPFRYWVSGSQS